MPYPASALGVLPPLWSRAAKKPRPVLIFSDWIAFTLPILAPAVRGWPAGRSRRPRPGESRPPGANGPDRAARPHVQIVARGVPLDLPGDVFGEVIRQSQDDGRDGRNVPGSQATD